MSKAQQDGYSAGLSYALDNSLQPTRLALLLVTSR